MPEDDAGKQAVFCEVVDSTLLVLRDMGDADAWHSVTSPLHFSADKFARTAMVPAEPRANFFH